MSSFSYLVHSELFLFSLMTLEGLLSANLLSANLSLTWDPNTQWTTAAHPHVLLIVWPRLQSEFKYNSEWLISY